MLSDGEYTVVIDPFVTGNPNAPVAMDSLKPDFIVLTHAHGDHLGDAIQLAKDNDSMIIAVNELANYVASHGVKAHNMHIGGGWNFPFGRLKFTIAHHGSSTPDGMYMGEPAGVVITIGGKTVYHAGDTGIFLDMKLIGIDDAVKSVEFVNPKLAIPMHYNTFPVIAADPNTFKNKVENLGKEARVLDFGESVLFD
jgi:L-ascorbate metabolism protein UlaG (beta-lactamase superfamily)